MMELIEEREDITQAIASIMEDFQSARRGALITLEEIVRQSGIGLYGTGWNSLIKRLSAEFLRTRGIELINERGIGYRLATPKDQIVERPQWRFRRAIRQISKGIKTLRSINDEELSDHQRIMRAKLLAGNKEIRRGIKAKSREQSAIFSVKETSHSARKRATESKGMAALQQGIE